MGHNGDEWAGTLGAIETSGPEEWGTMETSGPEEWGTMEMSGPVH